MAEYLKHLAPPSLGRMFLAYIVANGRLVERSKSVNGTTGKLINRLVTEKGCDRVLVRVAVNSEERLLVSHDLGDISRKSRKVLGDKLGISIMTSQQALANVQKNSSEPE